MSLRLMTAKTLNALKGWPQMNAVDFNATFEPTIPAGELPLPPGAVVSLNSSGKFVPGVGTNSVMPMFLFYGSDDPTVSYENGDPATEAGVSVGMTPAGVGLALPAVGAYELVSTAYVSDTYAPNDPLTSDASGGTDPGKLRKGTLYTDMIVGIVSRGVVNNGYGHSALAFWPHPVFPTPAGP